MKSPTTVANALTVNRDISNREFAVGTDRFVVRPPIKTCIKIILKKTN